MHHKFCFLKKSHPQGWYTAIVMEWPSLPSHVRSPASCTHVFLFLCLLPRFGGAHLLVAFW